MWLASEGKHQYCRWILRHLLVIMGQNPIYNSQRSDCNRVSLKWSVYLHTISVWFCLLELMLIQNPFSFLSYIWLSSFIAAQSGFFWVHCWYLNTILYTDFFLKPVHKLTYITQCSSEKPVVKWIRKVFTHYPYHHQESLVNILWKTCFFKSQYN